MMKREQEPNGSSIKRGEQLVECGCCHARDPLFLHNIRQRGLFRRFCTNCVLKTHLGLFCPICLQIFDEPPPPHQRIICLKCPAVCHISCPSKFSNESAFICPTCYNPGFNFFDVHPFKKLKSGTVNESGKDEGPKFIGKEASKALMVAAKLSASSMARAAEFLKFDSERKVKESAQARKMAKEALERLAFVAAHEERNESSGDCKGLLKEPVPANAGARRYGLVEVKASNALHPVNAPELQNQHSNRGMQP